MTVSSVNNQLTSRQEETIRIIREKANDLAEFIEGSVEDCRRRELALFDVESSSMWAVKAVTHGDD